MLEGEIEAGVQIDREQYYNDMRHLSRWWAVAIILLILICSGFVYLNRMSEKVVTTAVTLIIANLLGLLFYKRNAGGRGWYETFHEWIATEKPVTAIIPSALTLFLVGTILVQLPTLKATFPAMIAVNTRDRSFRHISPIHYDSYRQGMFVDLLRQIHPEVFRDIPKGESPGNFNMLFYNQFLQAQILRFISFRTSGSWQPEVIELDEYSFVIQGHKKVNSTVYSVDEIERLMPINPFAAVRAGNPLQIYLPPGTKLRAIVPSAGEGIKRVGRLIFTNTFFELSIETSEIGSDVTGESEFRTPASGFAPGEVSFEWFKVKMNCTFSSGFPGILICLNTAIGLKA